MTANDKLQRRRGRGKSNFGKLRDEEIQNKYRVIITEGFEEQIKHFTGSRGKEGKDVVPGEEEEIV